MVDDTSRDRFTNHRWLPGRNNDNSRRMRPFMHSCLVVRRCLSGSAATSVKAESIKGLSKLSLDSLDFLEAGEHVDGGERWNR